MENLRNQKDILKLSGLLLHDINNNKGVFKTKGKKRERLFKILFAIFSNFQNIGPRAGFLNENFEIKDMETILLKLENLYSNSINTTASP